MEEEVLKLATALGGGGDSETLRTLCAQAVEELRGRLREGVSPEACGGAFPVAAAWLALALLHSAEDGDVTAFTAGEVSVRREDGESRRKGLREQAMELMRPYLRDDGFVFRAVRS